MSVQRAWTWMTGMKLSLKHERMEKAWGGMLPGALCFPIVPEVNSEKSPSGFLASG